MATITLSTFRSEPGRTVDHLALHMEAVERLRALGMAAVPMQPVAGSDVGTLSITISHANAAEWAANLGKLRTDADWQQFYMRAMAGGAATQTESSIFVDVDPDFDQAGREFGCLLATQWRAVPGRGVDFMGKVAESMPIVQRHGGAPRAMQSIVGAHPMTTLVSTAFADLDAYGAYTDAISSDDEWLTFWAGAMSDPTADLIRTGVYTVMGA